MTATTPADLSAIEQMAADLGHATTLGHAMMPPIRITGQPGFRSRHTAYCRSCASTLIVYIGEPPAHSWGGCDLPCRGGG